MANVAGIMLNGGLLATFCLIIGNWPQSAKADYATWWVLGLCRHIASRWWTAVLAEMQTLGQSRRDGRFGQRQPWKAKTNCEHEKMFFDTQPELLRPIHSLLKTPFAFSAGASIATRLQQHLREREDFEDILALGCLFDEATQILKASMVLLRSRLENELSLSIPVETDLSSICCTDFQGKTPQVFDLDGARYLSHVSVQCQLERLFDFFELQRSGSASPLGLSECREALKILMLSEALALSLAGVAKVRRNEGGFSLHVRNSMAKDVLRTTWFARTADQSSHAATLALAKQLARNDINHLRDVAVLTERILEQDLSLPWHKIGAEARELKTVKQIHASAGLVSLLAVLGMQGKSLRMSGPDLSRYGLDYGFVARLIQRQLTALATDQFIARHGDQLALRIEGASKGLRQLFRSWEIEYGERDALRLQVGGCFYEKTHIRQRIEQGDDYQPRYRLHDGFDRDKVIGRAPNECDVEFVIEDSEHGHYYFIQAKHALLGEKAFLEAVVEAIQKDIGKGVHQLREAKRLLECGHLDETLRSRGIDNATPANCSFVLLHNIAQLDFQYTHDGISLYDWASFRNLLKDGECRHGRSDGVSRLIRLPTPLIAMHPMAVIQRLLTEHPAYTQLASDPWPQERATTSYELLGRAIHIHGLAI